MTRNQDGHKLQRTLRKRIMRLATWNIQGLRTKQAKVLKEPKEKNIDICVLTKTKKKGKGNEKIGEYIHFYSGVSFIRNTKTISRVGRNHAGDRKKMEKS
ncbi:hypothetical protein RN001_003866 [Aquatica leii]|uniref:Uncharacterized protein n=1 Tax=Aquatica leii TaxID=1421715 RepID=A0AAN7ST39_9COLE|nr:hypothetical protein RN001_003866 [Aquatica leii]